MDLRQPIEHDESEFKYSAVRLLKTWKEYKLSEKQEIQDTFI